MRFFKRWGERFTGSLKSSLSIALLAHADDKSQKFSLEMKRDYNEFTSMVQASVLGGTDSRSEHMLNRKGLKLISKFNEKIEWLLYANDFDKALEYIEEATTIAIISGASYHEKILNSLKEEVFKEKEASERIVSDAQEIAGILKRDPEDEANVLRALAVARDSVDHAQQIIAGFSVNKGSSLKKWQDQLIDTKVGIIDIMDRKLEKQYKAEYKIRHGSPIKDPNIKGKGWMVHYMPGNIVSVINTSYRKALGLPEDITHDEVLISLRDFNVHDENVARVLWESLKK